MESTYYAKQYPLDIVSKRMFLEVFDGSGSEVLLTLFPKLVLYL
ncbi:MAG: hypothetical protein M2R45_02473 [Verrucomicrobia subdivision 3 bacterium]|nr:hypothetical protein [Limisphaerales bacterium]MCS1413261.1 hypothetical protein [Limisphaerales bacterium]